MTVDVSSPFKEYGKLLVESSVLLSTNPATADETFAVLLETDQVC